LLNRKESRIQNPESKKLHSNDLRAFPPVPDFASIAWTRTEAHLSAKGGEMLLNSVFWLLNSGCASTIVDRTPQVPKHVKLLAIGNSFSQNATRFLPQIVKAAGDELTPSTLDNHAIPATWQQFPDTSRPHLRHL
jgi:hypothetical protein